MPSLLLGVELFTLTPGLLLKLERCQSWFLKHIFYVPSFNPGRILLKMSEFNSVASEIAIKKLLFLNRIWHRLSEICFSAELKAIMRQLWHLPEYCVVLVRSW